MNKTLPVIIDGIKCYSPAVANLHTDYPDCGFELTDQVVESNFWTRSRNRIFKYLVLSNRAGKQVTKFLEIGCGTGDFIRTLAGESSLEITGSEVYVNGLSYAKNSSPNVEFVQIDITQDCLDNKFDIIAAFDVIEHVDADVSAIGNMYNMLSDHGKLIVSVPQYQFMWSRIDEIVRHKRRYSRRELIDKIQQSGFKVKFITSFVCLLFPFMLLSRALEKIRKDDTTDDEFLKKAMNLPKFVNAIFDYVMVVEEKLIKSGISLPYGGTLIIVPEK